MQQLVGPGAGCVPPQPQQHAEELEVGPAGQPPVPGPLLTEHQAGVPPDLSRSARHVVPGDVRIALVGQDRCAQHGQQRPLTRAVAAAQRDPLAGPNIKIDAV